MKATSVLLLNAALVNAHWVMSNFIFDNSITGEFEYVREITPFVDSVSDEDTLLAYPNTKIESPDLRCGRNATLGWSRPKVATAKSGNTVGFFVGKSIKGYDPPNMYHPGFGSAWLSKVEDGDPNAYEGDGDWYKITQTAGRTSQSVDLDDPANQPYDKFKAVWGTYKATSYLIRWESPFPNRVDAQFFVNCAHIEVVNAGSAVQPTAEYLVKIPGVYTRGQKDVYFDSYEYGLAGSLDGFVNPKPDVWQG